MAIDMGTTSTHLLGSRPVRLEYRVDDLTGEQCENGRCASVAFTMQPGRRMVMFSSLSPLPEAWGQE